MLTSEQARKMARDHSASMSPEARSERARAAGIERWTRAKGFDALSPDERAILRESFAKVMEHAESGRATPRQKELLIKLRDILRRIVLDARARRGSK